MALFSLLVFGSHFIFLSLLALNNSVLAATLNKTIASRLEEKADKLRSATLTQIVQTTRENIPQDVILTLEGQLLSVNELEDVQPTDWAFEAVILQK